ncbi:MULTISPECIES: hypothetical protein [unclassified Janthinobacterium]|uniref:hypothetical protein n=1 Tax=unclassified Janthinobacterium TaxID=2610881 RepID=UPI0016135B73|nr:MULTISPECIES: hypothetical protein [unclassified Janthinobacterium]MBB5367519.1 hypothetical protein [Janthinobacterium sp. K2C7]MBB5380003.1 hypothetical protein [Janthinobacterium sp. K2Li3]MBB5385901.1 hypothetical protein [Janthinobacterium sp. K2E3]
MRNVLVCLILCFSISNVYAFESAVGRVTSIEASYLPGTMFFSLDGGSKSCPAGVRIEWSKADLANNKAVYATLLTSLVAGKKLSIVINDGDTNCKGQFIYIVAD